jgi:hypothetical protein
VHNVSDVRQIEVHTAEPLVPGPSRLEVEIAISKLKNYKSSGRDQIPANPCGGDGLEYLHRNPASRKTRLKGNPVPEGITEPPCSWGIQIPGLGYPSWGSLK